jgi:hypothetical protein
MFGRMVKLRGVLNLPVANRVTFKVKTNDYVKFQVDGKKLLYLSPEWTPLTAEKSVNLVAGVHQVEYDLWLQHEQSVPPIMMSVGGAPQVPLDAVGQSLAVTVGH